MSASFTKDAGNTFQAGGSKVATDSEPGKVSFTDIRSDDSIDSDAEAYTSEDEAERELDAIEISGGWFITELQEQHLQPGVFFDINTRDGISCIGLFVRPYEEEGIQDSYVLRDVDFNMQTQNYDEFICKLDEIRPLSKDGQRYFRKLEYEDDFELSSNGCFSEKCENESISEEDDIVDLAALMIKAEIAREKTAALVGNIKFDACRKQQQACNNQSKNIESSFNNSDAKDTDGVIHEKRTFDQ